MNYQEKIERRDEQWRWAYRVACPSCKAAEGEPCGAAKPNGFGKRNHFPWIPHPPRILAARDAERRALEKLLSVAKRCVRLAGMDDPGPPEHPSLLAFVEVDLANAIRDLSRDLA